MPSSRTWMALMPYLFVTASSLLVAHTANTWLELRLQSLPTSLSAPLHPQPAQPPTDLSIDRLAALVGVSPKPSLAVIDEPVDGLEPSSLPYRLLGTLLDAGDPEWSLASLQGPMGQGVRTYMLHDRLEGDEVVAIERQRVVLRHGDRLEYLDGAGPTAPLPVLGVSVKAWTEDRFEVPRAELQRSLSNLIDLSSQARILPAFKDGKAQGFAVSAIRPGSLFARLGLHDGDVVTRVNGTALDDAQAMLELYGRLQRASRFEVELERHGSRVVQSYTVQ